MARNSAQNSLRKFWSCWCRSTSSRTRFADMAGDFGDYLEHREPKTHALPRHLVKVRDGNEETVHYFHAEDELAKFGSENPDLRLFGSSGDTEFIEASSSDKKERGNIRRAKHVE